MTRDSAYLRGSLASVGILLDAPTIPTSTATSSRATSDAPIDREVIREILVDRRAPANDLEWPTASCPSVRDAEDYRPPALEAWCLACDGAQPADAAGCLTCRARAAEIGAVGS